MTLPRFYSIKETAALYCRSPVPTYTSRSIVSQAQSGKEWCYEFQPVYVVSFLNFKMDVLGTEVRTEVALCDHGTNKPVSDKLRFIYTASPVYQE